MPIMPSPSSLWETTLLPLRLLFPMICRCYSPSHGRHGPVPLPGLHLGDGGEGAPGSWRGLVARVVESPMLGHWAEHCGAEKEVLVCCMKVNVAGHCVTTV